MKNVCLVDFGYVIDSVGGAERVLVDLANGLALRGINVSVVACENKDGDPYYKLNDGVRFYNIHQDKELSLATRVCRKLLKIVRIDYRFSMNKRSIDRELKKIFIEEDVDIILNFFPHHLYYVLGNRPRSVPVIQMLHGSADWFHSYLKNINDFTIYNRINEVDVLQVLLPSYKKELQKELSVRIETIPNMVSKQPRCKYTKNSLSCKI